MEKPPDYVIEAARKAALESPCCKSKRGVIAFLPSRHERYQRVKDATPEMSRADVARWLDHVIVGRGFNGPPEFFRCLGTEECKRDCSKRCLHAEHRAIRDTGEDQVWSDVELVHVKVAEVDGGHVVVPGGPPSCWQCSREVVEVGVRGVWLYEQPIDRAAFPAWRFYTARAFHEATLAHCGMRR